MAFSFNLDILIEQCPTSSVANHTLPAVFVHSFKAKYATHNQTILHVELKRLEHFRTIGMYIGSILFTTSALYFSNAVTFGKKAVESHRGLQQSLVCRSCVLQSLTRRLCPSSRQRWNPVDGFSERLLPSDRWQWSDVTGLQHQPLDDFGLPSTNWEWEGDWHADENFEGEPTEKGVSVQSCIPTFPCFGISFLFSGSRCLCVCRDGPTPWTSPPRTPKTRSGTPASDAGDGSATGHTKPWTAGLRCVCVCLFVHRRLISCVWPTDPPTADESSRSFQRHQLWRLGDQ